MSTTPQECYQRFLALLQDARGPLSRAALAERLGISEKTITRYVEKANSGGSDVKRVLLNGRAALQLGAVHALSGTWFQSSSVRSFGLMLELLEQLGYSPVAMELAPLKRELTRLIKRGLGHSELHDKLVIKPLAQRKVDPSVFHTLTQAVIRQQRVQLDYRARSPSAQGRSATTREISPSHIELYRNNWYLVAWCHRAQDWRYFALERVAAAILIDQPSTPGSALPTRRGYGIFDLSAQHTAHLRFSPRRTAWVADELWHSEQRDQIDSEGRLERRFPFGEATELIRDLMREGADVTVLAPAFLRDAVIEGHRQSLQNAQTP